MLVNIDIIVVAVVRIVCKFAVTLSCSLGLLFEMVIIVLLEALPGERAGVIIGVDTLVDVNTKIFEALMIGFRCVTPAPVKAFSCWASRSHCSMAVFDRTRVLQARTPSDHV